LICQCLCAQVVPKRPVALTQADVEALSAAGPRQSIDWNWLAGALDATPREDRQGFLKQLIASPREDLACSLAAYGILQGDAGLVETVSSRIADWSADCQSGILGDVTDKRPVLIEIPRSLAAAAITGSPIRQSGDKDRPPDPVGSAALLLGIFGTSSDRDMLPKLAGRYPWSAGSWLALADVGIITPELTQLGSATYQDDHINLLARVAAASALESVDGRAGEFAISQLQTYLTRLEHEGVAEMLPQVFQPHPAGKEFDDWMYMSKYATILRALMVLKSSTVGPMVLKNLASANDHIRIVCGTVAAIRWPEQLLQASQGLFSDREYAGLMAAVAIRHPELTSRAQGRTTPSQFEDAKAQIGKSGTRGISPGAGTIQVFWK
jgi:hypothetical protein